MQLIYFEKSRRFAKWLIAISVFSFILFLIFFGVSNAKELLRDNIMNDSLGILLTLSFLLTAIFCLLLGIALFIISSDAKDEITVMENRIKEQLKLS
ncbi:MAG TPA: hypothetical protein IAA29_18680 [Candidatus Paenibacillus intestinavium]|nr:hypothetical protein [Candidatus Paenibacillus intestinavium]